MLAVSKRIRYVIRILLTKKLKDSSSVAVSAANFMW